MCISLSLSFLCDEHANKIIEVTMFDMNGAMLLKQTRPIGAAGKRIEVAEFRSYFAMMDLPCFDRSNLHMYFFLYSLAFQLELALHLLYKMNDF